MDIKIDFKKIIKNNLSEENIIFEEFPKKIIIDFEEIEEINQFDFIKLIKIYNNFNKSNLFFINLKKYPRKQLNFLLNRDEKIKVLYETKRN